MAEAQFSDQSGDPAGQFMRAADFGQNFMQRRQRQQWEQDDRTENQRVRTLFEPVLQAQRQAQVATALSSLETNKQQQQLRTRFAAEAPKYDKMYQDAMALPTFDAQEKALAQIQPQVTWMGLIPEGKGFVDSVNNSRALAFQSTMTDKHIKGTVDVATANNAGRLADVQERNAGSLAVANVRGPQATADQRLLSNYEQAVKDGDVDAQNYYKARITRNTQPRLSDSDRLLALQQEANDIRSTNPAGAKILDDRIKSLTGQANAFSIEALKAAISSFGQPGGTTTPTPAPVVQPPVVTGDKVVAPAPIGSGTTTTTTIVKDPGFVW